MKKSKTKQPANKPRATANAVAKKTAKPSKHKIIKELATHFEEDLNKALQVSIQPDGSVVYKQYYVRQNASDMWNLTSLHNHDVVDSYYLKTSALMAAKAYSKADLTKFFEIKELDNHYWASYSDSLIYQHNIKTAKDFDRFIILLNKLELSREQTEKYKDKISAMFRWSFV
jgi:hypothetical protein